MSDTDHESHLLPSSVCSAHLIDQICCMSDMSSRGDGELMRNNYSSNNIKNKHKNVISFSS